MALCALLAFGQGGIIAWAEDARLLEEGMALVRKGAHRKAVRVLTQANAEVGGQSLPVLVGLSAAHNGLEEHARAYSFAKEVLGAAEDAGLRAAAAKELAHAIAFGKVEGEENELEEASGEIRRYLALEPVGGFSDGLRQRLCSVRRQAGLTRPGAGVSSPLEVGEGVENPVSVHTPQPPFPEPGERRYLKKPERVTMQALIDADGCVDSIEILDATSEVWANIVVRQVARWVFRPATRDGRAVAVNYHLTTNWEKR